MATKRCLKCAVILEDYNWYPSAKKKCYYQCIPCMKIKTKKYQKENRERVNEVHRAWVKANPGYNRKHYLKHGWKSKLKYLYGLTVEQYNKMIKKSGGKCKLCGKKRKLCVDHSHETGKIRGLLCKSCNVHLGWFENRKNKILNYIGD